MCATSAPSAMFKIEIAEVGMPGVIADLPIAWPMLELPRENAGDVSTARYCRPALKECPLPTVVLQTGFRLGTSHSTSLPNDPSVSTCWESVKVTQSTVVLKLSPSRPEGTVKGR